MNFKEITDRLTVEGVTTEAFYRLFSKFYAEDRGQHQAGHERLPWLGNVVVADLGEESGDITTHTYHLPEHNVYLQLYGSIRERKDDEDDEILTFPQYPACILTFVDWFDNVEPYVHTETRYKQVARA